MARKGNYMRIDKQLDIFLKAKTSQQSHRQKQREQVVKTAWKCLQIGQLSAFDYVAICNKNNQMAF